MYLFISNVCIYKTLVRLVNIQYGSNSWLYEDNIMDICSGLDFTQNSKISVPTSGSHEFYPS